MKQSYIETYINGEGDIVLVYLPEASQGKSPEVETITIQMVDIDRIVNFLLDEKQYKSL